MSDFRKPAAGGGSGITQLTGDVTAGPGSGSQAATVAAVGGKTAAQVATGVTQADTAVQRPGDTMTGPLIITTSLPQLQINGTGTEIQMAAASGNQSSIQFRNPDVFGGLAATITVDNNGNVSIQSNNAGGDVSLTGGGNTSIQVQAGSIGLNGVAGADQITAAADLASTLVIPTVAPQTVSFAVPTIPGEVFPCDATAGAITVTLPNLSTVSGYRLTFIKTDVSVNTVTISGAQNINGLASYVLSAQFSSVTIVGDNTSLEWWVVAKI